MQHQWVIWGFDVLKWKKKSFKVKEVVEISLSAQTNNGKSLKVASNKSFCWWFSRRFKSHQRYLCPAHYEDKMGGNRSILFLIGEEVEAMANAKVTDQQKLLMWETREHHLYM